MSDETREPDSFVRFDRVWKRFRRGEVHDSLRDLLPALTRRVLRRGPAPEALATNEFWALRDVSFEVRPGQALGIIGGNGAGKSTALKVLTRILRPNRGLVDVRGRIGALIEIAAGFHPDLTGGENIFLQGSIMGMPVELIRRRFDEIVEFSGVGEFIDTPVKRYSSGMNARLGFAIAAHLNPEVLIIDEVLSVGDFRYQERAFGRIGQLVRSGIPVVIVSHQLDRIASLCTDALVLERGVVAKRGSPAECISWYLSGTSATGADAATAGIRLHSLTVLGTKEVAGGEPVALELAGEINAPFSGADLVGIRVRSAASAHIVFATTTQRCGVEFSGPGPFRLRIGLEMNLPPGVYSLEPFVRDRASELDVYTGPIAYAQVTEDPGFTGSSQLKPNMRLE